MAKTATKKKDTSAKRSEQVTAKADAKGAGESKRAVARKAAVERGNKTPQQAATKIVELLNTHGDMPRWRLMTRMTGFERGIRESALSKLVGAGKVLKERVETGMRGRPAEMFSLA